MKHALIPLLIVSALIGAGEAIAWAPSARLFSAAAADAGDAARVAAASSGGQVIDVQTSRSGGQLVYLVKVLLADGRVKVVRISGKSNSAE